MRTAKRWHAKIALIWNATPPEKYFSGGVCYMILERLPFAFAKATSDKPDGQLAE
ncbi:MAG: hypothetical protein ACYDBB_11015 [Armatimonadota bacterium]